MLSLVNLTHNVDKKWIFFAYLAQTIINLVIVTVRTTVRFISGWEMDGRRRTNASWFTTGTAPVDEKETGLSWWCYRPRLVRAFVRLAVVTGIVVVVLAVIRDAETTMRAGVTLAVILVTLAVWHAVKTRDARAFRRYYVKPTAATLASYLGWPASAPWQRWLHISPDLEGLAPPPSKALSPAEEWVRRFYGTYLQPILRWLPEHMQRLADWWDDDVPEAAPVDEDQAPEAAPETPAKPQTRKAKSKARREAARVRADQTKAKVKTGAAFFIRPSEDKGPRIEIRANTGVFLTPDDEAMIQTIIEKKLGPGKDLTGGWDQRGTDALGVWTAVLEPPLKVSYEGLIKIIDGCADHEIYLGMDKHENPVIISLDGDSPHIACSAGSGAGKSILAMLIAIQVLRKGGRVKIIDFKSSSHPWAVNLPGVEYAIEIEDIHDMLIAAEREADMRNKESHHQNPYHENPDAENDEFKSYSVGPRHFIIFEEMNATIAKLIAYWAEIREPSDPKTSPAVVAFRNLMFMGRSANMNMFGVAQMLTAKTTGGPEARENFGTRCLARFTKNNWRMLVPECAYPRKKSKVRGRWQIVVEGTATETQVPFTEDLRMARRIAVPVRVPDQATPTAPRADVGGPAGTAPVVPIAAEDLAALDSIESLYSEMLTLPEAIRAGLVLDNYENARKRIKRAQEGESKDEPIWPVEGEMKGNAKLYRAEDLIEFFTPVPTSEEVAQNK